MTPEEKDYFNEKFDLVHENQRDMNVKLDVLTRTTERNQVTLFGEHGSNGINGKQKILEAKVEDLEKFKWKSIGLFSAISGALTVASHLAITIFKHE